MWMWAALTSVMLSAVSWYVMLLLSVLKLITKKARPTAGSVTGGELAGPASQRLVKVLMHAYGRL